MSCELGEVAHVFNTELGPQVKCVPRSPDIQPMGGYAEAGGIHGWQPMDCNENPDNMVVKLDGVPNLPYLCVDRNSFNVAFRRTTEGECLTFPLSFGPSTPDAVIRFGKSCAPVCPEGLTLDVNEWGFELGCYDPHISPKCARTEDGANVEWYKCACDQKDQVSLAVKDGNGNGFIMCADRLSLTNVIDGIYWGWEDSCHRVSDEIAGIRADGAVYVKCGNAASPL